MSRRNKKFPGKKCLYGAAGIVLAGSILVSGAGMPPVSVKGAQEEKQPLAGVSDILRTYLEESKGTEDLMPEAEDLMGVAALNCEGEAAEVEANEVPVTKSEYTDVAIARVDNYVNVRSEPNTESEVLGKLYDKSAATVLEATEDGWYRIQSGNVNGFVKSEYVVVGDEELAKAVSTRYASVTTTTLYVRTEPTTESSVLTMLPEGDDFVVVDESIEGWVRVTTEEGEGYVSKEYVALSTEYVQAESKAEEVARLAKEEAERQAATEAARRAREEEARAASAKSASKPKKTSSSNNAGTASDQSPGSSNGQAVVDYASQFVGNPYVYGGSSLTNGADCSGFVKSVYAQFGVGLPHSSAALRNAGYEVSVSDIQPGDLVCYSGHVGIYAGNNTLLHASSPKTGIKYTSPITYRSILAVRRIF